MAVLERSELEASPLADLHAIADQVGLDGFRRLRKAELIDAILGETAGRRRAHADATPRTADDGRSARARGVAARSRRAARARRPTRDARRRPEDAEAAEESRCDRRRARSADAHVRCRDRSRRGSRREALARRARSGALGARARGERRGGARGCRAGASPRASSRCSATAPRSCASTRPSRPTTTSTSRPPRSAAASSSPATASAGPVRTPAPLRALPVAGPHRHDQRRVGGHGLRRGRATRICRSPSRASAWRSAPSDPTLEAIEWLTPLGRGSRAVIVGARRARARPRRCGGCSTRCAGARASRSASCSPASRPEEIAEWQDGPLAPAAALSFAASADAQGQAVERAIDAAKRVAARGGNALVLIDSLDGAAPARGAQGAGRGAQPPRRRLADGDRDRRARRSAARRR